MSKQPQGFWPQAFEEVETQNDPLSICIESAAVGASSNTTPDYLRVESIEGKEAISQPFSLSVQLRADDVYGNTQDASPIVLGDSTLGLWACVKLSAPSNTVGVGNATNATMTLGQTPRYFRGIITELSMADPGCYSLTLSSPLHLLTLQNRYHIYQGKDIAGLITELLSPYTHNFTLQTDKITGTTAARCQDWLQAGETDMAFLQRIMSKADIHYYFVHQQTQLILVFSNTPSSRDSVTIPGYHSGPIPLRYTYANIDALGLHQNDLFCGLRYSVKMMPKINNTLLTTVPPVWSGNAIAPPINTYGDDPGAKNTQEQGSYFLHHYYDYGAVASDPQQRIAIEPAEAARQLQDLQKQVSTSAGTLTGSVTTPLLGAGYAFTLENPFITEKPVAENPMLGRSEFNGKYFVVTQIHHKMSGDQAYSGTVEATEITNTAQVSDQTLLTPFSMQGTHQGSVVAKVIAEGSGDKSKSWRFNDKSNFGLAANSVSYSGEGASGSIAQKGVKVELVTGQCCWVKLSATSQSIPEVGAVVMIGRSSNQSEQPELQQVLSSHGSKTIQPADGGFSWQAHTNWGSSYSVNYGNSVSLSNGSFSLGHSEIGKSVNFSITGQGDGLTDPASDYQAIKKVSDSLSTGDSYNKSHTKGKSINLSGTGTSPPAFLETAGLVSYSNSRTVGDVVNNSVTIGAVASNSVTVGATSNITTNTGAVNSITNINGAVSNTTNNNGAVNNITNNNGLMNNVTVTTGITTTLDTFIGRKFEKQIHIDGRDKEGTHTQLFTNTEVNLEGKEETYTTTGDYSRTVDTTGNFTNSELVTGDKTSIVTTDGALMLNEIVTGDKIHKINNSGAVTINEKTTGAREVNITNSGVSKLNTSYVGEANITYSFAAPPTISYTGSPCMVTMAGLNLTVEPEMTVTAPELTVTAETSVELTTPELTLTAATSAKITAPELNVTAAASAEVTAPDLTLTAAGTMELTSPDLTISSPALTIEAAEMTITSAMVTIM